VNPQGSRYSAAATIKEDRPQLSDFEWDSQVGEAPDALPRAIPGFMGLKTDPSASPWGDILTLVMSFLFVRYSHFADKGNG
jgi:hypothetical protein